MITYKELLHGHNVSDVPIAHQHNLEELLTKMNIIRNAYGKPMIVTSGYRSEQDQKRINPKVTNSAHMIGKACDILDSSGFLMQWCKANVKLLEDTGLWIEADTNGWVHFQTRVASQRFFKA